MRFVEKDLHQALKKYFGFGAFKGLQEDVIKSIIEGMTPLLLCPLEEGNLYVTSCLHL